MLRRLGLLCPLVLALVLGLALPGWAARWSGPDPTGDAVTLGSTPDPPPCGTLTEGRSRVGDIRRLAVVHAGDAVALTLDTAGLRRLDDVHLTLPPRTERRAYEVDVDLRPGRPARASLSTATRYGPLSEPDKCGISTSVAARRASTAASTPGSNAAPGGSR